MSSSEFTVSMKFASSDVRGITLGSVHNQGARDYQEDSFGSSQDKNGTAPEYGFTAVVADGMGGLSDGAQVSGYVVRSLLELQKHRDTSVPAHIHLSEAMRTVNNDILKSGMKGGSTAAAVMCLTSGIYWCTVGDSRVYLFRKGLLTLLNEDSDYLNRLIEKVISREMTYEDAVKDSQKDALTQYMGYKGGIVPDVNCRPLIPEINDKLLICSDGVYNAASAAELSGALAHPAGEAAEIIEKTVLSKKYSNQDNFTAVVLEFIC